VEILRRLALKAGVPLWSDRPDIVYASRDSATVIATDAGDRTLTFPVALQPATGGEPSKIHRVKMQFGEVRVFLAPEV
jgi:hypothetical protein